MSHFNLNLGVSIFLGILVAILLGGGGYGYYFFDTELTKSTNLIASTTAEILQLKQENQTLTDALYSEKEKNRSFEEQINGIASAVGVLEKFNQTDPELLQKYSKVYFLNEHYLPAKLIKLDSQYLANKDREEYLSAQVWPYLRRLIRAAENDNINLEIISGYRSFNTQGDLKAGYKVTYGTGANTFSADQGYSEHQLGTTVDLTTKELGTAYTKLATSPAYKWLQQNAHRYGFVLSYPEKNAYYQYEPWHWRFVGVALATELHEREKFFYDLDQREINTYLINLFD